MGSQIKLEKPGDEHTMKIAEVVVDDSGQFPSALFYGENGDWIKMSYPTAERTLDRLTWTVDSVNELVTREAVWLRFSRAENKNRGQSPYWNVELAQSRSAAPNTRTASRTPPSTDRASQSPPAASTAKAEPAKVQVPLFEAYKAIRAAVVEDIVGDAADEWRTEDINDVAATVFIAHQKEPNRVVFAPKKAVQRKAPEPEYEDFPAALRDDDDNLPF